MPTFTLQVFRGTSQSGGFQEYRVESDEGMVLLDVVHRLQAMQANDLAVRWNCKAASAGRAARKSTASRGSCA